MTSTKKSVRAFRSAEAGEQFRKLHVMPAAGSSLEYLFSYGTLQLESVQLATFGRRIAGTADALAGFEQSVVELEDGMAAAPSGRAQFPIIMFSGRDSDIVRGLVLRADRKSTRLNSSH